MSELTAPEVSIPRARLASLRRVAIVPAHNEEGSIGGVVREIRAFDDGLEIVVIDDGSWDRTAARRARRRRPGRLAPVQPRDRRRRPDRVPARRGGGLRPRRPARRRRAARLASELPKLLGPILDDRRRHRRRLALRGRGRLPAAARAPARDPALRLGRLAPDAAAGHRHDLRLPGLNRRAIRAVRGRLPARLPRGRGDGDGLQAPAAARRGAGGDAASARPGRRRSARSRPSTTWSR